MRRRNRSAKNGRPAAWQAAPELELVELESRNGFLRSRLDALHRSYGELLSSSCFYTDLFQSAPVGYILHDVSGVIHAANRAAHALLGYTLEGRSKASLTSCIAREDLSRWLAHVRQCQLKRGTRRTEVRLALADGRSTPVELTTLMLSNRHPVKGSRFYSIIVDVTQRHESEAALALTQRNYHRLIDTIEGIVWEADAQSLEVTFVSNFAERLLGYPVSEWTRRGFLENRIYVEDRERVLNHIARAVAERQHLRIEYRVLTAARNLVWLHDSITVAERDGRLYLLGVSVDVTDRRNAETELRRANDLLEARVAERTRELRQSLADLEAFSYSLSHDLRSPIRSIVGFATLAMRRSGGNLSTEAQEYLNRICSSAGRADALIRDVLTYSKLSREEMVLVPTDLDKLLRELIAQFPEFQEPKASIQLESPLLPVMGHEACLGQCLTNLLSNAVKFVPKGKKPRIKIWTEPREAKVRIFIEDNGIGIEPANVNRIFGIFERVNSRDAYEGTGIGLAIVRKGVERLGGQVGVDSTPGRGSRFWIQLNPPAHE